MSDALPRYECGLRIDGVQVTVEPGRFDEVSIRVLIRGKPCPRYTARDGQQTDVVSQRSIPRDWLRDGVQLRRIVRTMIADAFEHEIDEWLAEDGRYLADPHGTGAAEVPAPPRNPLLEQRAAIRAQHVARPR